MLRTTIYILLFSVVCFLMITCGQQEESPYLNVKNKEAHYVGMQECKTCHSDKYESFMRTGMGKSWGLATREKSSADFSPEHALVYDSSLNFYYKPFWDRDSMYIMEFRLEGKDTVHKLIEKVSYIVGSGQHTNSHLTFTNGYLHQAPITFYTQKGKWDLAPGFEKGHNSRFSRKIELECITCHNAYPEFVEGSLNKYANIPLGIDCERCHGPGSIHVENKRKGDILDTANQIDYSIVNPKKMSTEQQNNLCMRCHLQGVTVLNEGKSFFDFRPSQLLQHTMNTFMPVFSDDENNMIMASHVERMKLSRCYVTSAKMSCITCHNPHISVKETPVEHFNTACVSCHTAENTCKESLTSRQAEKNNCVHCHMPKNSSIDIPHVAVTDHKIRVVRKVEKNISSVARFIRMQCYSRNDADDRTKAKGFMEFYERYEPEAFYLDSAKNYLSRYMGRKTMPDNDVIRYYFLSSNYEEIISLVMNIEPKEVKEAWSAYRIAESYAQKGNHERALSFLEQAVALKPYALDFQNKYVAELIANKRWDEARRVCFFLLSEYPHQSMVCFNLGFIYDQQQNIEQAQRYYEFALKYNPDHVQSLINLSVIYYRMNKKDRIRSLLVKALKIEPDNEQVRSMLSDL